MSPTIATRVWNLTTLGTVLGVGLAVVSGCGSSDQARAPTTPTPADQQQVAADRHLQSGERTLKDTPFERAWDLQFPRPVLASWINPHIPDLILFELAGGGHEIYGVDAASGQTRWVTAAFPKVIKLSPDVTSVKSPDGKGGVNPVSDDRIWVVSDDVLYSIDALYGQVIWRYALPFSPSTAPLALGTDMDQRIFMGDWDGRMQVVTFHPEKHFPYMLWQINLHSPVASKPVEIGNRVYAADQNGTLHCFEYDRADVWQFPTGSPIADSPLVQERTLFVGNDDNKLYAINRFTGEQTGQIFLSGPIRRSPFAFQHEPHRVYAWVYDKNRGSFGLSAVKAVNDSIPFADAKRRPLEIERMAEEWFAPEVDRLVASSPDYLFATLGKSSLVKAINRATGAVDWTWDVNEEHNLYRDEHGNLDRRRVAFLAQYQDPTDRNRTIFTADETGHVIAYRIYGDKPGDPLGGNRVRTADARGTQVIPDTDTGEKPPVGKGKPADDAAASPDAKPGDAKTGDAKPDAPADGKPAADAPAK